MISTLSHQDFQVKMKQRIYTSKIQGVKKALELLRSRQSSHAAKEFKRITSDVSDRSTFHCGSSKLHNSRERKKRTITSSGFSHSLISTEIRKSVMRHNWVHVAQLLPLLLKGRLETEPLIWRCMIIELFYSKKSTLASLNHFLEMCVGSKNKEFLKRVLTLPSEDEDSDFI